MLDPNIRRLYLDELKPPAPYVLDRAVGTTFSLDLLSLLVVPLSLAFSEAGGEEALRDQIAVLEALQRTADRLGIFCQQGRIAVPRADSLLYSYLEPAVIEVRPPGGKGVFHPKIWLLRFTADGLPPLHRFVCLSRNLTFDQSWDTVLTLEGTVEEGRKNAFSRNRPLAAFIAALPSLAVGPVPASLREHVEMLADEVLRVRFRVPDGFNEEEYDFIPLGLKGYRQPPAFKDHSRMMIVSPFLSGDALAPLAVAGTNNVLISRGESLDALPPGLLDKIRVRTQVYILNEAAEKPDTEDEEFERGEDLSGLHAKLYVAEHGWNARLLTGSANATDAAFHQNVEFLVELRGRRAQIGIDKILGEREERGSLLGMLLPYQPGTVDDKAKIRKELEQLLEQARQAVAGAGLSLKVTPEPGGTYALSLAGNEPLALASNLGAACYPITLDRNHARDLARSNPAPRWTSRASPPLRSRVSWPSDSAWRRTGKRRGSRLCSICRRRACPKGVTRRSCAVSSRTKASSYATCSSSSPTIPAPTSWPASALRAAALVRTDLWAGWTCPSWRSSSRLTAVSRKSLRIYQG